MSTPAPAKVYEQHVRVSLLGSMGAAAGSLERFSVSLNLNANPGLLVGLNQAVADDIAADCRTFWADVRNGIGSRAKLDTVKCAKIGTNGKYLSDPFISAFPPVAGTAIGVDHPFQVSLCVSLLTARRGPSGRGRIYLPCPTLSVSGDGTVAAGTVDAVSAAVGAFITNLNNSPGVDRPGSQVLIASSKGFSSPVTGVRTGRVLDTIRSRRTQLLENYGAVVGVS